MSQPAVEVYIQRPVCVHVAVECAHNLNRLFVIVLGWVMNRGRGLCCRHGRMTLVTTGELVNDDVEVTMTALVVVDD